MAAMGTHIRFAIDVKGFFDVADDVAYLAGTVYPDSRSMTKTPRELTHPLSYRGDPIFFSSDFRKGWLTHLVCDDVQHELMHEMLPELFTGTTGHNGEVWQNETTLKLLQNNLDVCDFDVSRHLSFVSRVETPNGESPSLVQAYHTSMARAYERPLTPISLPTYIALWKDAHIVDPQVIASLAQRYERYEQDESVRRTLPLLYPEMLKRAKHVILHACNHDRSCG